MTQAVDAKTAQLSRTNEILRMKQEQIQSNQYKMDGLNAQVRPHLLVYAVQRASALYNVDYALLHSALVCQ